MAKYIKCLASSTRHIQFYRWIKHVVFSWWSLSLQGDAVYHSIFEECTLLIWWITSKQLVGLAWGLLTLGTTLLLWFEQTSVLTNVFIQGQQIFHIIFDLWFWCMKLWFGSKFLHKMHSQIGGIDAKFEVIAPFSASEHNNTLSAALNKCASLTEFWIFENIWSSAAQFFFSHMKNKQTNS